MLNNLSIMGRLTADPELKTTPSGKYVTSFDIAVERDSKGPDGERYTDFFTVVAWNQAAQTVARYLGKGRQIIVKGSLQTRSWEDKNGQKRKAVEILMDRFYFADSQKTDSAPKSPAQQTYPTQAMNTHDRTVDVEYEEISAPAGVFNDFADDDLPF